MKCYFVYSIPNNQSKYYIVRVLFRIKRILFQNTFLKYFAKRRFTQTDFSKWPIKSPFENTKHIYIALNNKFDTLLYHLTENIKIKFNENDIFLGHPFFPINNKKNRGITENSLYGKNRPKVVAIITPLHANNTIITSHINKAYIEHVEELAKECDLLFAIMGEYWYDQFEKSLYENIKKKMIRLDMAIEINNYPRVKERFNSKGKRRFLYIGRNDPLKGIDFLSNIASKFPEGKFAWIGSGKEIKGVKKISENTALTEQFMKKIAEDYDFFISPSLADANPTTILESMAWGFPVLATQQSGYYESDIIKNIFIDNIEKTHEIIESYDYMDENILKSISVSGRSLVEKHYTWNIVTSNISREIEKVYLDKSK